MSKSIFEALFYGRINAWERRASQSRERKEIECKIQAEKGYFKENMTADDYQRFQVLESLYTQASEDEEIGIFAHGLTLGALIMLEVMTGQEGVINE